MSEEKSYFVDKVIIKATTRALIEAKAPIAEMFVQAIDEKKGINQFQGLGKHQINSLKVNLTLDQIKELIAQLGKIQLAVGATAIFEGRQINLIILAWNQIDKEIGNSN